MLVRPTEKVSRKSATGEKNESRALVGHDGSIELIKRDAVKKELQSDENWMHFYVYKKIPQHSNTVKSMSRLFFLIFASVFQLFKTTSLMKWSGS